jgi:zinc protease
MLEMARKSLHPMNSFTIMKHLFSFLLTAMLVETTIAQTRLIEKVQSKGGEIIIPYEKYQLSNGLTLIVHEDHSDPVVHVDVTYHVGSAREELNKSGFAHFFEHMMFQGSENVGDEQHFKIISEAGGTLNGSTNRDITNYYQTMPSNQLEVALWLEADRMGFLLDSVTQQKFEIQRATVKNERGQNYDNRPYGLIGETTSKTLYPYGHPYSWLTIGYVEDLNRVGVQDLKNFFLRWYGPNNATLSIGGDVDPKEVVTLVEKYFGSIPRGPEVSKMTLPLPTLERDRYTWYEDKIRFPWLQMVWPGVPHYHSDEVALDCLAEILGGGPNSLFYKNLVKAQLAIQAGVSNPCSELAGEFTMSVIAYPDKSLADMEKIVRSTLKEFESRGVTDDDLIRFKAGYESGLINSLQSVAGKVAQLAAFETFTGNPNYLTISNKKHAELSKEDVIRVYNTYIKDKPAVILSVVPTGKANQAASQEKYEVSKTQNVITIKEDYRGLKFVKAKDNFNRRIKPEGGPNPVIKVPTLYKGTWTNGVRYLGTKNSELPVVTLQIIIPGGHKLSAGNPQKAGIAALTTEMLNESTLKYSTEAFSNELEKLGSSVYFTSGADNITLVIQCLLKNLDKTLLLAEERLFRPALNQEDFERAKKQQLEAIANQNTQPSSIANRAFNKLVYGEGHIYSISSTGTTATVESLSLDDVKTFYKQFISPKKAQMIVVGDIDQATLEAKTGFLQKWSGPDYTIPNLPSDGGYTDMTRLFVIDKENAPQSEIRIGYLALPFDAFGLYYKAYLMNYNLGGAFNSRINLNLREEKGYTYGARSGFSGGEDKGPFLASASVRGDATDSSVFEFMKEIRKFRDQGITANELAFMKSAIGQSEARNYETLLQKAGFLRRIIQFNLPEDFTQRQNDILQSISVAEINSVAKRLLLDEKFFIVVVGDKKKLVPGLARLNYPMIEMNKDGEIIGGIPASNEHLQFEVAPYQKPSNEANETPVRVESNNPIKKEEPREGKRKSKPKKKD